MSRNNLGQFVPGESGNPEGRKRGTGYRQRAEAQFATFLKLIVDDGGTTAAEAIIQRMIDEAKKGEPWALKMAMDRLLPVVTKHEVEVDEAVGIADLETALARLRNRPNGSAKPEPAGTNGSSRSSA